VIERVVVAGSKVEIGDERDGSERGDRTLTKP